MQRYGIGSGVVISAVDLIKGIGVYAGLESIDVEGATGLYNTNYEGKAQAAIEALRTHDFVFLHIEASDEAGHEGDVALKMKTIEYLDRRIVKPILDAVRPGTTGFDRHPAGSPDSVRAPHPHVETDPVHDLPDERTGRRGAGVRRIRSSERQLWRPFGRSVHGTIHFKKIVRKAASGPSVKAKKR